MLNTTGSRVRLITRFRPTSGNYVGGIVVYENGRRLWSNMSTLLRLSRGDALSDARRLAVDTIRANATAQWADAWVQDVQQGRYTSGGIMWAVSPADPMNKPAGSPASHNRKEV